MYHPQRRVNLKPRSLSLHMEFKMKASANEAEEQNKPNKDHFILI